MNPLRLRLIAPLFVLALTLASPTRASSPALAATDTELTAQDGSALIITRGTLDVPARRGVAGGPTLRIAFVRVRSGDARGDTAHLVLAGGPGASGIDGVMSLARHGRAALALFGGDVIGMDQRGTGQSLPKLDLPDTVALPLDAPGSAESWLPLIRAGSARAAARLRAGGVDPLAFNTVESAEDADALREALGYRSLVLWGRSYGSHLAIAIARRHGAHVQRLVLVSPEGPDHTWKLPAQVDAVIARVAERAQRPGLPGDIASVMQRLRGNPVTVRLRDGSGHLRRIPIGVLDLQLLTLRALGDPRTLATLPAAYARMARGDFDAVAPLVLEQRRHWRLGSAMKHFTDLSAAPGAARAARIAREEGDSLLGAAVNFPGPAMSDAWGVQDLGDAFRAPWASDLPTLILVGDLDPRTPLENAHEIAQCLPNAKVVVLRNGTHQFDLFGSAPLRAVISAFLADAPVPDTVALPPIRFQPVR
ncbi:alpha/beta fold hydrolase [Arenimonas sp. MALMAid1274]|uniref:alpha/beta fold hydrolase n=1 Tax=Arenimonas sp. MALMAid1274 TaxID=3411630 RepID=UPI003BA0C6DC